MEKQLYYFQTYGELYVIEYEIKIKIIILNDAKLRMLPFYNNEMN